MLRKLLTLIAIVTGLAATGAPAQARIEAMNGVLLAAESGQESGSEAGIRRKGGDTAAPASNGKKRDCIVLAARPCMPSPQLGSVLVGIDRARE